MTRRRLRLAKRFGHCLKLLRHGCFDLGGLVGDNVFDESADGSWWWSAGLLLSKGAAFLLKVGCWPRAGADAGGAELSEGLGELG